MMKMKNLIAGVACAAAVFAVFPTTAAAWDYEDMMEYQMLVNAGVIPGGAGTGAATVPTYTAPTATAKISFEKAKQIAQQQAPGAYLVKWEYDWDYGGPVYGFEFRKGWIEYDIDVSGTTGGIMKYDVDYD